MYTFTIPQDCSTKKKETVCFSDLQDVIPFEIYNNANYKNAIFKIKKTNLNMYIDKGYSLKEAFLKIKRIEKENFHGEIRVSPFLWSHNNTVLVTDIKL